MSRTAARHSPQQPLSQALRMADAVELGDEGVWRMRSLWKVACGALAFVSIALAQPQDVGDESRGPAEVAAPSMTYAGVREYRWTFRVPVITVEHRKIVTRVYAPTMRARRLDYAVPDFGDKRTKLGRVAEFSCKYSD